MRRKILFIAIAIFCVFALSMSLLGAKNIKLHRDYTLAVPLFSVWVDSNGGDVDTIYHLIPVIDTTYDTNFYGEVDTVGEERYPWPSVYDQNSQEGIESFDTGGAFVSHMTFDRWAMEDWAFCFFIADSNVAEVTDSVSAYVQYQFPGAPGWTVPYTLFTDTDASANILTYYPLDLYDNWKLYRNARIMLIVTSDSVSVEAWIVGRQILYHRHVDPGE